MENNACDATLSSTGIKRRDLKGINGLVLHVYCKEGDNANIGSPIWRDSKPLEGGERGSDFP